MADLKNLLFEIGTEELPSSCIKEGVSGLYSKLEESLKESRVGFAGISTFGTPRRIVGYVSGMEPVQYPKEKIVTGPPKKIAVSPDGKFTEAATGFARSLNIDASELQEIDNGRGIYMGLRVMEKTRTTAEVLPGLLKNIVTSLAFSKQMTWGDYGIRFARPIRWLIALYGDTFLEFNIEGVASSDNTFGIRSVSMGPLKLPRIKDLQDYLDFLEKRGSVILDASKRKDMILDSIKKIESSTWKNSYKVVIDEELLEEVVNLVEMPNVLIGGFPEEYLYIPREILVKAIQHHQRYFAVIGSRGDVAPRFVVVQNGVADKKGEVISGNERVLKARLSDARFFYEEDRKHDFDFWYKKLEGVIFYSGLGSIHDKAERLIKNCLEIAGCFDRDGKSKISASTEDLRRASIICKCDLVTNLVVEFPELQGLVGREYAKEKGEKPDVASSVFEHYLPRFAGDILPETDTGSILSISDKVDTIAGMFLADNIPSGSQDPFALRRKASGIILTALKKGFDIDVYRISEFSVNQYIEKPGFEHIDPGKLIKDIAGFIMARYRFSFERASRRVDLFDAIASSGCYRLVEFDLRYRALEKYVSKKDPVKNMAEPFIRCKNIIKGVESSEIKKEYLVEASEKKLVKVLTQKKKSIQGLLADREHDAALMELEDFAGYVNQFFDDVLVMDNDKNLRTNRLDIVKSCADLYLLFADFAKIS